MLVRTADGKATIHAPDGTIHRLLYEPLDEAAMILQARYHQFIRGKHWRRAFRCHRCGEHLEPDQWLDEEGGTWELLMVCSCRAIYGKLELSKLPLPTLSSGS